MRKIDSFASIFQFTDILANEYKNCLTQFIFNYSQQITFSFIPNDLFLDNEFSSMAHSVREKIILFAITLSIISNLFFYNIILYSKHNKIKYRELLSHIYNNKKTIIFCLLIIITVTTTIRYYIYNGISNLGFSRSNLLDSYTLFSLYPLMNCLSSCIRTFVIICVKQGVNLNVIQEHHNKRLYFDNIIYGLNKRNLLLYIFMLSIIKPFFLFIICDKECIKESIFIFNINSSRESSPLFVQDSSPEVQEASPEAQGSSSQVQESSSQTQAPTVSKSDIYTLNRRPKWINAEDIDLYFSYPLLTRKYLHNEIRLIMYEMNAVRNKYNWARNDIDRLVKQGKVVPLFNEGVIKGFMSSDDKIQQACNTKIEDCKCCVQKMYNGAARYKWYEELGKVKFNMSDTLQTEIFNFMQEYPFYSVPELLDLYNKAHEQGGLRYVYDPRDKPVPQNHVPPVYTLRDMIAKSDFFTELERTKGVPLIPVNESPEELQTSQTSRISQVDERPLSPILSQVRERLQTPERSKSPEESRILERLQAPEESQARKRSFSQMSEFFNISEDSD